MLLSVPLGHSVASDFDSVMTWLYGLANSVYLQKGDLISDQAEKFIRENYENNDIVANYALYQFNTEALAHHMR